MYVFSATPFVVK